MEEVGERSKSSVEEVKRKATKMTAEQLTQGQEVDGEVRDSREDPSLPCDCCIPLVLKGEGEKPFPTLLASFAPCPKQVGDLQQ